MNRFIADEPQPPAVWWEQAKKPPAAPQPPQADPAPETQPKPDPADELYGWLSMPGV